MVDKELSGYSKWKEGAKLSNLDKEYWRLKDDVNKFVNYLQKNILAKTV